MGAIRPRYVAGWSDPRGLYADDGLEGIQHKERGTGYDPTLKRKTCEKCHHLTWHRDDHCTEC